MRNWIVYYEIPPMRDVFTERVLSETAYKAKLHIEITIPNCKVTKVER